MSDPRNPVSPAPSDGPEDGGWRAPHPPVQRPTSRKPILLVAAIVAVLVLVGGTGIYLLGGDGSEERGGRPGSVAGAGKGPRPDHVPEMRGPQVRTGKELERYLLGGLDLPNGMAVEPGSLKSGGRLSAVAPSGPTGEPVCTDDALSKIEDGGQPKAEIAFTSPEGRVRFFEGIYAGPPGSFARILAWTRRSIERCPEVTGTEDGKKTHMSYRIEGGGFTPDGFRVRTRISMTDSVGSTRTVNGLAAYERLGDAMVVVLALAEGREPQPADGFDTVVAKAVGKVRRPS